MAGAWIVDAPEGSPNFIAAVPGDDIIRALPPKRLEAMECDRGVALVDADNNVVEWLEIYGEDE